MANKPTKSKPAEPRPLTLVSVRPNERNLSEGNVLEHPLFKLSNKEARPNRGRDEDGKILYANEDYTRVYELTMDWKKDGSHTRRVLEVRASAHYGYPTMFAFRVLLAIIDKAHKLNWENVQVPVSRPEICAALGCDDYGGTQFALIDNALEAMRAMSLSFHETWYDFAGKKHHPGIRTTSLISNFSFAPKEPGKGARNQLTFGGFQFVELGADLFGSLKSGYRIGVDLDYINRLGDNVTAQRLYSYLTKKDRGAEYTEGVKSLALKLPLVKTTPSGIREALVPALELLSAPQGPDSKQFLKSFDFTGARANQQLTVQFFGHEPSGT